MYYGYMLNANRIKARIISWLLQGNLCFDRTKDAIGSEVLFSQQRRRADLLILSDVFHALEIKSDFDNTLKLKQQLEDYTKTFDKTSVITTRKHISSVRRIASPSVGLIIFEQGEFCVLRAAKLRRKLKKASLLMFLTKSDLYRRVSFNNDGSLSADEVRDLASDRLSLKETRNAAYENLRTKYARLFYLFMRDTDGNAVCDELKGLSGSVGKIVT